MKTESLHGELAIDLLKGIASPTSSCTNTYSCYPPMSAANGWFSIGTNPTPSYSEPASQPVQTDVSTITFQLPPLYPIFAMPELIREATIDVCCESKAPEALV